MTEYMTPVSLTEPMKFDCCRENSCFNDCCRDLNQALTPYDVLRLKQGLEISSQEFLKQYTSLHYGPGSGLPVVAFKPNPGTGHACPFVSPEGCKIYADRPASCRMYPLARGVSMSRETKEITEFYALIEESHCRGFEKESGLTVKEWLEGQGVSYYNIQNDNLMELISLKNKILPGKLEGALADKFYLGLYDTDEFRFKIQNDNLLKDMSIPNDVLERIINNDEELMDFGLKWVKYMLFGILIELGD
jgi:uncharacterized protein